MVRENIPLQQGVEAGYLSSEPEEGRKPLVVTAQGCVFSSGKSKGKGSFFGIG